VGLLSKEIIVKIAVLSDLHLEFGRYDLDFAPADVLILSGDIMSSHQTEMRVYHNFIHRAYDFYGEENVLEIEGNHTGYGGDIGRFGNIQYFEKRGDVALIGATLWSGEGSQMAYTCLNDKHIGGFTWEWQHERHLDDLNFIEDALIDSKGMKQVVFTHHLPSVECVHSRWLSDGIGGINLGFYTDLDWLLNKYHPTMWICGHTHDGFHKFHSNGKTQMVCNPRGYVNRFSGFPENEDFDPFKVVEIE